MESTSHFLHELYGLPRDIAAPVDRLVRMGKAVLIVAGADREISDQELTYFLGLAACYGAAPEALEEYRSFDYRKARLNDYLEPSDASWGAALVYDAVRVAGADGRYAVQERAAVRRMALLVGLDGPAVTAIESLVEAERALRQLRIALLRPQ